MRGLRVVSVDPPGCTDIDDALHCRRLANGHWEVGVHIADVAHFVRAQTALDDEAASRATTVYLVDKRIDMLPTALSTDTCSLRGGEERLTFSCIWELDDQAGVVETRFHKSIIRSTAALTYEQAQNQIDDRSDQSPLANDLRQLNILAKVCALCFLFSVFLFAHRQQTNKQKLRAARIARGALTLASTQVRRWAFWALLAHRCRVAARRCALCARPTRRWPTSRGASVLGAQRVASGADVCAQHC